MLLCLFLIEIKITQEHWQTYQTKGYRQEICVMECYINLKTKFAHTVKPVYKGHSREPKNVAFMSSCSLYTGWNYMHYSLMGKMKLPYRQWFVIYRVAL